MQDPTSVMPGQVYGETIVEGPYMDGPYFDEPVYGESLSAGMGCDDMLCSGGNCGDCGGVGCDSGAFCDSPGGFGGPRTRCGHDHGWWPCITLCFPRDGWFSAEYLQWTQRGMYLPPLVTRGNAFNTYPTLSANTLAYGGNNDYAEGELDGVRLNFGFFMDQCHEWSVAADYFEFSAASEHARFVGLNGGDSLGRPFFDISLGNAANVLPINYAGLDAYGNAISSTGSIDVHASSELVSGGMQFRRFLVGRNGVGDTIFLRLPAQYRSRMDLGIGYRYTQLDENLMISNMSQSTPGTTATSFSAMDGFTTRSQFNGFDFGIFYTRTRGRWNLDLQGRFGIGVNRQSIDITGSHIDSGTAGVGGLLAQSSNIGSYSRDRMSVLPEFRTTLGYRVTPRMRLTVGYTFLYWSNVVRPGDQIDLDINGTQVGGGAYTSTRPTFDFNETDYWAQGVSFGADFRW